MGVVGGPERQTTHPRSGGGDLACGRHALAGLDNRHQVDAPGVETALAFELSEQPVYLQQLGGTLDFRQHDAVKPFAHDRQEIAVTKRRIAGVDANITFAGTRPFQCLDHRLTRRNLFVDRDRIFQVQNYCIGAETENLLHFSRVIARCKNKCT